MKTHFIPLALLAVTAGCASQSPTEQFVGDAAAVGGGSAVAYELSKGNPVVTVAGGVAALGVKKIADNMAQKKRDTEVQKAYNQGLAQGLKTKYWEHQEEQSRDTAIAADGQSSDYLPITAPERVVNGVVVKPSVEYIRVDGAPAAK